jgi:hypothetical protein
MASKKIWGVSDSKGKSEGKDHPITGHEDPEGSTAVLDGKVVNVTRRPFYSRERLGAHCIGGWMGPRAVLEGCGKSRPQRYLIPEPSIP